MEAIEFQDVEKQYGDRKVLEHFNLSVEKGEFLTVVGSSGCGKTTMLKMINGLIQPESGEVIVNGKKVRTEELTHFRRKIGYCIQGNALFPHMTVEENIAYVPSLSRRRDKKETAKAVKRCMEVVNLPQELRFRYPDELSGGQQQRVGIARALAASPDILLMDEPFGAVDEITRGQLQKEIRRIHGETKVTVVFVTHDISEALYLGTKVLVMDKGNIQQYDTPENLEKFPANPFVEELLKSRAKRRA